MARTVTTFFNMKENYSGGMRRAAAATSRFQHQVTAAARVLDRENRKRREIKINSRNANSAIAQVSAQMKKIKDLRINIAARVQNFKRDMKPVTNDIKSLVKKPLLVTLKLKDMALSGLKKVGDLLKSLARGATIGLGIAGGAMAYTLGKGMTLQQYQASIEHNVFAANRNMPENQIQAQAKTYTDWLLDFQAKTSASLIDVFTGGSHALTATGGDIPAAKGVLKIAQDMVAKNPTKDLFDAVEAIRDATTGQYRRMIEFGFSIGAEEMKAAGGDVFKAKDPMGRTMVDMFSGAEERYIKTPAGIWDTIKGTVEGGIAQAGSNMLNALQPFLLSMLPYADTIETKLANMGTSIGTWLADTLPKLKSFFDGLKPIFDSLMTWISDKWAMLQPFRDKISSAFSGVDGEKVVGGIGDAMDSLVNTLISWLNGLAANWDKVEPVIAGIIKYLPQIAAVFAGIKIVGWGVTTGKAVGNFFGGAGKFLSNLFGRGATTVTPPATTPAAGDPLLKKATAPKTGPNTNTFTGPNYNTFQGPNTNTNAPGTGPGTGGGLPGMPVLYFPPSGNPFALPAGNTPLGLPSGANPGGINPGDGAGFMNRLTSGLVGFGFMAAIASTQSEIQRINDLEKTQPKFTLIDWIMGKPNPLDKPPVNVAVTTDLSAVPSGIQAIINGHTVNGNIKLMINNGGGSGLPVLQEKEAAGIKRVPWDNYPALLHKGESVLPSGEAGEYRSQGNSRGGGVTVHVGSVNINGANKNGEQLAAEFVRGLERAAFNMA